MVNGSPRPKGNTKQMIKAFCEGLEKAGHEWLKKQNFRNTAEDAYTG